MVVSFCVWELIKDRVASWANNKIDEGANIMMEYFAPLIEELAVASLGYTVALAILVMIVIYIHAYVKENTRELPAPDNKTRKESIVHKPIRKQSEKGKYKPTAEQDFDEFAKHKDAGTTPELQPDVDMYEAIEYLINILFPDKQKNVGNIDIENTKAVNLITEKLRNGELKSWGLYVGESVERKFSKDDWAYKELLPLQASIPTTKEPQTRPVASTDEHPLTGLRVNMSQVKSLWRRAGKDPVIQAKSNKHDVSLLEAIHYVTSGKWGNVCKLVKSEDVLVSDEFIEQVAKAWRDIQQSAIDGDIRIWGLDSREHWILITDNTYWQRHWINWMQIMTADEENDWSLDDIFGDDYNDKTRQDELYHRYNTSKKDVEKLWQ